MLHNDPQTQERRLQRELRFLCIMGPARGKADAAPSVPQELFNLGLVDDKGWVTPKGREFMRG